ncbi:hypothetical protein [Mycolicibacterium stellerae]|uniref:hypothetical protein n=1 Tax=Mycolicibacterium stellerae TaxID=2358193 RepID=UPI000F0B0085|nr:hypothetical protein [Mycolicibacterium stellerae]
MRFGFTTLVLLTLVTPLVSACVRTDEGVAIRSESAATPTAERPQEPTKSTEDAGPAAPGIVTTSRSPVPADTVTCSEPVKPAVSAVAQVSDPAAPKITVAVPDGWSNGPGSGDVGLRMQGPDGMLATVTIAQTKLDPAEAFTEYADKVMAVSAVSSVSVLPAELCGYSGQKLMGAWSDTPQQSVEFLDRIVHIWTNTDDYLVAVHVQAPAGTDGFDAASTVLIEDFAVGIP